MTTKNNLGGMLRRGDVLDNTYEVISGIGEGGMGSVFRARHLRLESRQVAIKVLADRLADRDEFVHRFRREAEIGAKLGHPNIVAVTDWNVLPSGHPYLVMDLIEGDTLDERLKGEQLTHEEVFVMLTQIARGLIAAHAAGIVHRDLKPSNLFVVAGRGVEDPDWVKILDFGISKIVTNETLAATDSGLVGTPRYMAPEQVRSAKELVDHRSDQFAMAAIAFEMFAGESAFGSGTPHTILYKIVHSEPPFLGDLAPNAPEQAISAIHRGLSKFGGERFANMAEFTNALVGRKVLHAPASLDHPPGSEVAEPPRPAIATVNLLSPTMLAKSVAAASAAAELAYRSAVEVPSAPAKSGIRSTVLIVALSILLAGIGAFVVLELTGPDNSQGGQVLDLGWAVSESATARTAVQGGTGAGESGAAEVGQQQQGGAASDDEVEVRGEAVANKEPVTDDSMTQAKADGRAPKKSTRPTADASSVGRQVAGLPERPSDSSALNRLEQAESLRRAGRYKQALYKLGQSLVHQDSVAARQEKFLTYCSMRDLGNARASLLRVPSAKQRHAISSCGRLGMEL